MKTSITIVASMLLWQVTWGAIGFYAPPQAPTTIGNSSLAPFNNSAPTRTQQVYGYDAFPVIEPNSAFLIRQITFRGDENALPSGGTTSFPSVEVHLSTTSRNPDGLSTVFSDNIGTDDMSVLGPGPLNLSWSAHGFATFLTLERPFFYNPAAGNLLLDIRNYTPSAFAALDAYELSADSLSTTVGLADATTGFASTRALATFFTVDIVPVPEPGTAVLLCLGLLGLGWKFRRCHKLSSTHR